MSVGREFHCFGTRIEKALAKGFCLTSNIIVIKMVMIIVKIVLPFVPCSLFYGSSIHFCGGKRNACVSILRLQLCRRLQQKEVDLLTVCACVSV